MGKVAAKIEVMPKDAETNLKKVKEQILYNLEDVDIRSVDEEDVAFGLKKLMMTIVVADDEGGTEEVEEKIRELDDVENVTVKDVNRLM
ncbi:elongation factor 1-beta [archaeon SCG-AAA382B04]|nr:elongation factor 1-beta [archaeon SCG-AAA382B04]